VRVSVRWPGVTRVRRPALVVSLVLVLVAGMAGSMRARGQTTSATAPVVVAAFLLNFVKFVDWPPDVLTAESPVVMCVADPAVAEALSLALAKRPATARRVTVKEMRGADVAPGECAVVYVADLDARRTRALLAGLGGRSVLSVSMDEDFAERGGTIGLFLDDGTMKFAVNPRAAERSRLRVSSQLLSLARIVKE
jgi:hypothetical protein